MLEAAIIGSGRSTPGWCSSRRRIRRLRRASWRWTLAFTQKPPGGEESRSVNHLDCSRKPGGFRASWLQRAWGYAWLRINETSRRTPPHTYAAWRRFLFSLSVLAGPVGFERSVTFAWAMVRSLQMPSSVNTTNLTNVRRRRHLYRTFSRNRNIRLVRSTWLLVRTRRLTGLFKYTISLGIFSASICSIALTSSGTARNAGSRTIAARRQPAWWRSLGASNSQ